MKDSKGTVKKDNPEHLNILVNKLKEEVKALEDKKENLQMQVFDASHRKEEAQKYDEDKIARERNKLIVEVNAMKSKVVSREEAVRRHEERLEEREMTVNKREQEIKDARDMFNKLEKERYEIYELRREAKRMTDEAKERMAEVVAWEETKQAELDNIAARRKAVEQLEKQWNDSIGKLEADIKKYNLDKADLEAREKALEGKLTKEVVNV